MVHQVAYRPRGIQPPRVPLVPRCLCTCAHLFSASRNLSRPLVLSSRSSFRTQREIHVGKCPNPQARSSTSSLMGPGHSVLLWSKSPSSQFYLGPLSFCGFCFILLVFFISSLKRFFDIKVTHACNLKCSPHPFPTSAKPPCSILVQLAILVIYFPFLNNLFTWLLDFPLWKWGVILLSFLPSFIFISPSHCPPLQPPPPCVVIG